MENTVLDEYDAASIVETIRLNIQHDDRRDVIIVVEGEDDEKALSNFFNLQIVEFFCAKNCLTVKDSMRIVSTDDQLKDCIIGIKDGDFDHLKEIKYDDIANLLMTDTHDMETMMLTPNVCRRICLETTKKEYPNLSLEAMTSLKNLSYLRYYNDKIILNAKGSNKKGINFKGIDINKVIPNYQPISVEKLLCMVKQLGNANKPLFPDLYTIEEFIKEHPINESQLALFTNGHDLIFAIRNKLHSEIPKAKEYSTKEIESLIRAYFSKNEFEKTKLYKDIDNWNNKRFDLWAV